MWPVPLIIVAFLAPESPWWLVRKNRIEDAKKSLLRLTSRPGDVDFNPDQTIAMMRHTIELEKEVSHCPPPSHPEVVLIARQRQGQATRTVSAVPIFDEPKSSVVVGRFSSSVAVVSQSSSSMV